MCQRPIIVAQGCNLSVSPEIVAGRDDFAERGSVSRSTLGATTALDLSTRLAARTLLRVTDPRSPAEYNSAIRQIENLRYGCEPSAC